MPDIFTPDQVMQILQDRLLEVARIVQPWMPGQPPANVVKIENQNVQSLHVKIKQEGGLTTFTFVQRVAHPDEDVLIIAPGDSQVIDPNGESRNT